MCVFIETNTLERKKAVVCKKKIKDTYLNLTLYEKTNEYIFFDEWRYDVTNDKFHKGIEIVRLNGRLFQLVMATDNIYLCNG